MSNPSTIVRDQLEGFLRDYDVSDDVDNTLDYWSERIVLAIYDNIAHVAERENNNA